MYACRCPDVSGEFGVVTIGDDGGLLHRRCRGRPDFAGEGAQRGHELFACRPAWKSGVAKSPTAGREGF